MQESILEIDGGGGNGTELVAGPLTALGNTQNTAAEGYRMVRKSG